MNTPINNMYYTNKFVIRAQIVDITLLSMKPFNLSSIIESNKLYNQLRGALNRNNITHGDGKRERGGGERREEEGGKRGRGREGKREREEGEGERERGEEGEGRGREGNGKDRENLNPP